MGYKKCPRCNLNYIQDHEVLCKVCLAEVGKALKNKDEDEEYDICPECGENIIKEGEEMCYQCRMEKEKEEKTSNDGTNDYLDEDHDLSKSDKSHDDNEENDDIDDDDDEEDDDE